MTTQQWLKSRGFADFTTFPGEFESYEDHPVSQGGMRIEICGDVASIWCPTLKINILAMPVSDVIRVVEDLLEG